MSSELIVYTGEGVTFDFTILENGTPTDFTGDTLEVRSEVLLRNGAKVLKSFSATSPSAGAVQLVLDQSEFVDIKPGEYLYQLRSFASSIDSPIIVEDLLIVREGFFD